MMRYDLGGYRPAGLPLPPGLGQPTGATIRTTVGISSILAAALGAGTTYVGFRSGERERGPRKVLGYTVAVFGALVTISGLASVVGWIVYENQKTA